MGETEQPKTMASTLRAGLAARSFRMMETMDQYPALSPIAIALLIDRLSSGV
jgi:hypothetical protein